MEKWLWQASDGVRLTCLRAVAAEARGQLLLLHGMAEHPARYETFANELVAAGINVYAPAHRGHGASGREAGRMGYFAAQDGWQRILDDVRELRQQIRAAAPDLPFFLFGHSMGSYLARCVVQEDAQGLSAVILSGPAGPADASTSLLRLLAAAACRLRGPEAVSPVLNRLGNQRLNARFCKEGSDFAWLSRERSEVQRYEQDPDCGFPCCNSFSRDLAEGWQRFTRAEQRGGGGHRAGVTPALCGRKRGSGRLVWRRCAAFG